MEHYVYLKVPFRASIWGGDKAILPTKEDDRARLRRQNAGTRLEAVTHMKPVWVPRKYAYRVELWPEIIPEIALWETVRKVVLIED